MFLLNYFGFLKNNKKFQEKTKILFNKRLKVFENIVQSNTQNANIGNKFDVIDPIFTLKGLKYLYEKNLKQ